MIIKKVIIIIIDEWLSDWDSYNLVCWNINIITCKKLFK